MSLRIRKDGRVLCAAIHEAEPGDVYLDDSISYELTVKRRLFVTEPMEQHAVHGEWWPCNDVPDGVQIERRFRFDVTCRSRFEILAAYKVLVEHYHPDQGWVLYGTWEFGRGFGARPADKSGFERQLMIGRQCASLLLHFGEQL